VPSDRPRPALNLTGVVSAAAGLALFIWFVRRMGAAEIWADLRAVGWGFVAIVAITGARFSLRAAAWTQCIERPYRLSFSAALPAVLAGDAVGNLTPLGFFASEPAKAAFVRERVPLGPSLTALAIENIFYSLSVLAMIAASTIALLVTFDLPDVFRRAASIGVGLIAGVFVLVAWLLWRQPVLIGRVLAQILPRRSHLYKQVDRLHQLEERIYTFVVRRRDVVAPIVGAEVGFHALGVLEIYLTWWLMQGAPPPLLTAFILEGANRLITVVFKFVPLQLGIGELGTAGFTDLLGYGLTPGTSLSIVRKARIVFWVVVGTLVLVRRGIRRPQVEGF
jgi:hypothetical protein